MILQVVTIQDDDDFDINGTIDPVALGHSPDVIAKNPNLMAQEMLRDIARIARKQASEMVAAHKKGGQEVETQQVG